MASPDIDLGLGFGQIDKPLFPTGKTYAPDFLSNLPAHGYPIAGTEDETDELAVDPHRDQALITEKALLEQSADIFTHTSSHTPSERYDPRAKALRPPPTLPNNAS